MTCSILFDYIILYDRFKRLVYLLYDSLLMLCIVNYRYLKLFISLLNKTMLKHSFIDFLIPILIIRRKSQTPILLFIDLLFISLLFQIITLDKAIKIIIGCALNYSMLMVSLIFLNRNLISNGLRYFSGISKNIMVIEL